MTKQPVKLYVVRHGKTIFNAPDRMQGVRFARSVGSTPREDGESARPFTQWRHAPRTRLQFSRRRWGST